MKSAKLKSGINELNKQQLLASSKAIDAELAKHSRVIDMSKLNKTKIFRNEVFNFSFLFVLFSFACLRFLVFFFFFIS